MKADLHHHSTASDGRLSPASAVSRAAGQGTTHLALTDHDTTGGVAEARERAHEEGIHLIAGIEITTTLNGREIHVLGLFLDPGAEEVSGLEARCRLEREERLRDMHARLSEAGLALPWSAVEAQSAGGVLARPHLARALVAEGLVDSVQRAFDRWLVPGRPGWVERWSPDLADVIAIVRKAGGIASLAHPGSNDVSRKELSDMAQLGLDAVEALHPSHVETRVDAYQRWGRAVGLAVTGGSDFHAEGPPRTGGYDPEKCRTPQPDFDLLKDLARQRAASHGEGS